MITIYKTVGTELQQIPDFEPGSWGKVCAPTHEELDQLSKRFDIHPDFLTDPLDVDERARIEREEGVTLIVLRIPRLDTYEADVPFTTLPVGIILADEIIITICALDVDVVSDFSKGKVRNFSTEQRTRFILQLCMRTSLLYLKYLREINRLTNIVEKDLHRASRNEQLIKLLNLEKSLVFFQTSIRSNALMLEKLYNVKSIRMDPDESDLLDDLIIENRQAMEMTSIYAKVLNGTMTAFASLISNNLNMVMKSLATITIILMIPTLVASMYGMNVELPFQHTEYAFPFVMGVSLLLSVMGILIFWRKEIV